MDVAIIIPARYNSSRFQGKPLVSIAGKSLIERVWNTCIRVVGKNRTFVATDDERIVSHCSNLSIKTVLTPDCLTGTDRVFLANSIINAETIINVQGDEPLISVNDIQKIMDAHSKNQHCVHCGMCPVENEIDYWSKNVPKIVCSEDKLLYISRSPIPANKKGTICPAQKQVCIYAFSRSQLDRFGQQGQKTPLEEIEDIEILRFMEIGIDVRMVKVSSSISVDVPDDVYRVEGALREKL